MTMSEAEASAVLTADVAQFADGVRHALRREVNDAQFAALVSFAYNVGLGAFRSSSVLKAVNAGDFDAVPRRLQLWVKARGKVLPGLVKRRAAEAALFMSDSALTPDAGFADTGRPDFAGGKPPLQSTTVISGIVAGVAAVLSGGVGAASGASPVVLLLAAAGVAAALWIIRERVLKAREEGI
jgi:lysozyme